MKKRYIKAWQHNEKNQLEGHINDWSDNNPVNIISVQVWSDKEDKWNGVVFFEYD